MLVLDDSAKEALDREGIPYSDFVNPDDMYLSFMLNIALDTAMRYNDADYNNPEEVNKYVAFIRDSDVVKKCVNRIDKANHDIINFICDAVDGKHEEIMSYEPKEDK